MGSPWVVRLRRDPLARLRVEGLLESGTALGAIPALAAAGSMETVAEGLGVCSFLVLTFAVRAAVWTEYVEANERGIRWRSLFRSRSIFWDDIQSVGEGEMGLLFLGRGFDPIVLEIRLHVGRTRPLRASARCGDEARQEFLRTMWAHRVQS